jgi:hypothetical protein
MTNQLLAPFGTALVTDVDVVDAASALLIQSSYDVAPLTALHENAAGDVTTALFAGARSDGGVDGQVGWGTLIRTPAAELALQPPAFTVTLMLMTPDVPAEKRMLFVPSPEVIAPLVIDQLYDAPGCNGTLAALFVEFASTLSAVEMFASGVPPRETVCESLPLQLPLVTVTLYVTDAADCVTVMKRVASPVDQEYVV